EDQSHPLFSAVSRKLTTCFSSWRTQWSLLSRGRTVPLRKRFFLLPPKATTELSESFGISFKVKWEEKMWIETSCCIATSTRLRRVDVGRNQCCHLGSDEHICWKLQWLVLKSDPQ
ncbi:hypothetical protein HID58_001298, partial [Brassica napus]